MRPIMINQCVRWLPCKFKDIVVDYVRVDWKFGCVQMKLFCKNTIMSDTLQNPKLRTKDTTSTSSRPIAHFDIRIQLLGCLKQPPSRAAVMDPSQQLQNSRRSIMKVNRQSNVSSPRRHRAILSCATCRKRKIRCDRLTPCSQCVRSKIAETCYYPAASTASSSLSSPVPAAPRVPVQVQPSGQYIATPPTPTAEGSCEAHDLDHLESHDQVSDEVPSSSTFPNASLSWPSSIDPIQSLSPLSFRGKDQKTRFFGRSHWAMTLSMVRCYLRLHGFTV